MNSGIYKLTFPSGKYYIGKSANLERRWAEHFEKMMKGAHTRNLQNAFNAEGYPKREILLECHANHIDLMEPYFITGNLGPNMLNSAIPMTGTSEELEILQANLFTLTNSTATMCLALQQANKQVAQLEEKIRDLKKGTVVPQLEREIEELVEQATEYFTELQKFKSRNLFQRIFNITQ